MSGILRSISPTDSFGFACWSGPINAMARPHRHAELEMNHLTEGSVTYLLGGQLRRITAGQTIAFWGAVPHQVISVEGNGQFYWFTVPFAWVLAWGLPPAALRRMLTGDVLMDRRGTLLAESECRIWESDFSSGKQHLRKACELEMQARFLRLAGNSRLHRQTIPAGKIGPVERMAAFIAEHFAEPLTMEDISRASGLQQNYAMTLFRRTCGLTLLNYVIEHRLFHAQRLLTTTDRTVLDIALASGFGSVSRFHEAFQRFCGCSPGQFRKARRGGNRFAKKNSQVARS